MRCSLRSTFGASPARFEIPQIRSISARSEVACKAQRGWRACQGTIGRIYAHGDIRTDMSRALRILDRLLLRLLLLALDELSEVCHRREAVGVV